MWGDFEPNWKNKKEAEKIMGLLIAIMNSINSDFLDPKSQYQPLFEHREVEDVTYVIVDEWCFGYMRGVALCEQDWDLNNLTMNILITPIRTFGSYEGLALLRDMNDKEVDNIKKNIVPNVLEIFQFWRSADDVAPVYDDSSRPSTETFVRGVVKVGRNDPCSCGSGKKFKKCCLH